MDGIRVLPASTPGLAVLDDRYIKRFVNGVLTADTGTRTVEGGGSERVLESYGAQILGSVPTDLAPVLLGAGVGVQAYVQSRAIRNLSAASFVGVRFNGTPAAPAAVGSGNSVVDLAANPFDGVSTSRTAAITAQTTEAHTPTAKGTQWLIQVTPPGTTALTQIIRFFGDTVSQQIIGVLPTLKIRPLGGTGQLRTPTDSASMFEWNATGIGEYGAAPVAKPTITGSRGGNVALANLLAALALRGSLTDSTTP